MTKDKNLYSNRKYVIVGIALLITLIFIAQLFNLQIIDTKYRDFADSNAFYKRVLYPSRGAIYDRNGKLIVYNQPTYDVMMVVREMKSFDTIDFCKTVDISREDFIEYIDNMKNRKKNPGYSSYTPQLFMQKMSVKEHSLLQERLYKFPGVYIQNRTERQYKYPNMGLVLGYVSEADQKILNSDSYYRRGDYVGKSGVERSYEVHLRGEKGAEILLRDARGRVQGKYKDGEFDATPVSGKDLELSIDIDLQAYGEYIMSNKLGSIVMIEPSTGEVLCIVSSPSYDPVLLTGKNFSENYSKLLKDPYKPLINRSVSGVYPPASTFKISQGLIYLSENVISFGTHYSCAMGYPVLGGRPRCHPHGSPITLSPAIATSCNSFFCYGFTAMINNRKKTENAEQAVDLWHDYMNRLGYGVKLGIDMPSENSGFIPSSKFYNKVSKGRSWGATNILSICLGQGEVVATPLQVANMAAIVANRGYYYVPHVVRRVENSNLDELYSNRKSAGIDVGHYNVVVEGMRNAVLGGTCRGANIYDVEVCGKTGTAQNPHGDHHSWFMGFAPRNNPKVAIAVIVENGGYGASSAVPLAKLMMQKYFSNDGEIPEYDKHLEQHIVNKKVLPPIYLQRIKSRK